MKHKLSTFFAILMMALAIPQSARAIYDFSAVAPTGQTLYYIILNGYAEVIYPGGTTMGTPPYQDNQKPVGDLVIPDSVNYSGIKYAVKKIYAYAFSGCAGLTSVVIPEGVTTIGGRAFQGCYGLVSITISASVTSIKDYAFIGCDSLVSTYYNGNIQQWCSISFGGSFSNPASFSQNLYIDDTLISELVIPEGMTTMSQYSFYKCSSIISLTLPSTFTSLPCFAFQGCNALTTVYYNAVNCSSPYQTNQYQHIEHTFSYCNNLTNFIIGEEVESIPAYLCSELSNLKKIRIPESTITIGSNAFSNCGQLKSIYTGDGLTSIGPKAFNGCCDTLDTLYIGSSISTIGLNAFHRIRRIRNLFYNNNSMLYQSYQNGTGLLTESFMYIDTLYIGDSVESIGNDLFYQKLIKAVYFNNNLTSIGDRAFWNCDLRTLSIPNSVHLIGEEAFGENHELGTLSIGTGCTYIRDGAFYSYHLTSISCSATVPPHLGSQSFKGVNTTIPIYVPCESVSAYQSASGWSSFSNIQCNSAQTYTITVTSANPTMGTVTGGGTYNIGATATLTAMPNSGYHFVRWQDNNTQNPRTITVTANATYTAYFEADGGDDDCPAITQFPWNATFDESLSCWKTVDADGDGYNWVNYQDYVVSESYSYFDGSNQGLTPDNWLISRRIQIPSSGSYTLSWTARGLNDNYFNEHYSVYVSTTGDNPSNFSTQLFSETLNTPNAVNRSKSLESYRGQTIRIAFRHHNTNDVFVLGIGNVKISQGTQGIEDIEENDVHIYVEGQNIHISEIDGQDVTVYSIDGRTVASVTNAAGQCSIPVPATGVYMVKIGNHPARKVVVMR